jgi:hypothetical protein
MMAKEVTLDDIAAQMQLILEEMALLRQDVQRVLEHVPVQMIPADPDSEVQ